MASLPYPLNWLYNHGRVGMAGMPYPPTECRSYIKINMNTYLPCYIVLKFARFLFVQKYPFRDSCIVYTSRILTVFFAIRLLLSDV